jgi:PAS domain S-box-containing protein
MKRFLDTALRYGVAVLAVGVALELKLLLDPLITDQSPFLLLAGAVVVGAWFGGLGPGLLATALGALGADYFFLPPEGSFTGLAVAFWPLLLFTLQGILISSLVEALRSARKRAEQSAREARSHQESLRESEERFRLMVDGVKDYAIFMLDPGGCVTTWNDGAERIVGYGEGEILGRHFSSFYPEEDVERGHPEDILRAALAGGRYVEEGTKIRQDGSRFWASAVVTTLRDRKGNLKGFSMMVHDMTERKHTDDVLRFLAESGATLSSSLDYRETLANVARLAVPTLADWCAIDVMEEDGTVERLAVEHSDPENSSTRSR